MLITDTSYINYGLLILGCSISIEGGGGGWGGGTGVPWYLIFDFFRGCDI